jgi:hypothetical protein
MTVVTVTRKTIEETLEVFPVGSFLWLYQERLHAVMDLEETEERIDCAGEDQQEFN